MPEKRTKDELLAELTEAQSRIVAINDQYEGHYIDPDSADATEWNTLNARVDDIKKIVAQMTAREERIAALATDPKNTDEGFSFLTGRPNAVRGQDIYDLSTIRHSVSNPEQVRTELHSRARYAIEQARFAHPKASKEDSQTHVDRLLETADDQHGTFAKRILVTGSPTYKQAFGRWVATAGNGMTPQYQAAMSLGTDADGGFAVPFELDPTILLTSNGAVNPYRAISRIVQGTGKEWEGVTSAGVTAHRRAEAGEASDDSPTLAQPTVKAERVDTFIPFSVELQQDWGGLATELAMLIQDAKDIEEASSFTTGNGTSPNPEGLLTGATITVNTAGTATFASADLDKLEEALPYRFQPNAQFIGNRAIYNLIRHFADNNGPDLWVRIADPLAHGGNTGRTLHGYRANECSAMGTTHAAGDSLLVLGDFSRFLIYDKLGMSLELIPHLFATGNNRPSGQRGYFAYWRNNCKVLSPEAFRVLVALS